MNFAIKTKRSFWKEKRFFLPLISAATLAGAIAVLFAQSISSTVVVYNLTGENLRQLTVEACGQSASFMDVTDESSVRMRLRPTGHGSAIAIESRGESGWQWSGVFIEPQGGYRVTIRIFPGQHVEAHTQHSLWRRVLEM
jgi:hypothetical protein